MYSYVAFGLKIHSQIHIEMLPKFEVNEPDVQILKGDLKELKESLNDGYNYRNKPGDMFYYVAGVASFRITDGKTIIVDLEEDVQIGLASLYILGACMGTLLYQRGIFTIHGSCVTKDGCTVLVTGASGAGKSTMAAAFVQDGWKLLTDDVAALVEKDGKVYVQPSYPAQKLWNDAIARFDYSEDSIRPLYQSTRKDKFYVDVRTQFDDTPRELNKIIWLSRAEENSVEEVSKLQIVHLLTSNSYCYYIVLPEDRQKWFQRCVTLASQAEMLCAFRTSTPGREGEIYKAITNWLEG